jgi:hypothetical protein
MFCLPKVSGSVYEFGGGVRSASVETPSGGAFCAFAARPFRLNENEGELRC